MLENEKPGGDGRPQPGSIPNAQPDPTSMDSLSQSKNVRRLPDRAELEELVLGGGDEPASNTAPAVPADAGETNTGWGEAALRGLIAELEAADTGERNDTLNRVSFRAGQMIPDGHVDGADAAERLLFAALSLGLSKSEATATIKSSVSKGKKHPRSATSGGYLLTEDSVAKTFAERFNGRLLYCHTAKKWFEWIGTHWREDRKETVFNYARVLVREVARSEPDRVRFIASKRNFACNVKAIAQADPVFAVTSEDWNQDQFLLATPGGTVDLRTGQLRPARPEDRITRLAAVAPAETDYCPYWKQFLRETTGGDLELIRFMQQFLGYSLTGDTREHALLFVYGPGRNGKSVFLNVATGIMAEYAKSAPMDTFTTAHGDRHPTELAMLDGARLVTASETESGRAWAEARIKQLTGGDPITARYMRQDFFTFTPRFKLVVVGNHKPVLHNVDDAARRRFNIVPFTRRPARQDLELETRLKDEWPAILRWMIEGALDWQLNGLQRPECVRAATAEYFDAQDTFGQWLTDACECEPGNPNKWEASADLFGSWSSFADQAGERAGNGNQFAERMLGRGFARKKGTKGARAYVGIQLRKGEDDFLR